MDIWHWIFGLAFLVILIHDTWLFGQVRELQATNRELRRQRDQP